MDDAEYIFREDIKEKKKAGRSAGCKVRGGGRWVRTPSDNLTWKERQEMNSECVSYDLKRPVSWKTFCAWPDDIQGEYIQRLRGKYDVQATEIAKMFGVTSTTFSHWSKEHGVVWPRRGKDSKKAGDNWYEFLGLIPTTTSAAAPGGEPSLEDILDMLYMEKPKEAPEEPKERETKATLHETNNIAAILAMLVGTGAKLTIEVTL